MVSVLSSRLPKDTSTNGHVSAAVWSITGKR